MTVVSALGERFGRVEQPEARVSTIAGLVTVLPALAMVLIRVGINAPFAPRLPYGAVYDPVAVAAVLGPALAALAIAVVTADDVLRVAMAFAGVFGLLTVIARPAALPAALAMVAATGLIVVAHARRPFSADEVAETLVGFTFFVGVSLSIGANLGIEPATTRWLGSVVSLFAIAGTPVFVEWDRRSLTIGAIVGAAIAGFGFAAPFVVGATSLVAGSIVGASLPSMVLAVVGGVTLVTTGLRRREFTVAIAGLIILSAGVPATIPRALTLAVGLALLTTPTIHD